MYNQIFETLVVKKEENSVERLIGMLAYAEYKLDKHEWMKQNPKSSPEEEEAFLRHYSERILKKYCIDAENFLLTYAEQYSEAQLNEKLESCKEELLSQQIKKGITDLSDEIAKTKISFWIPVWQGVVASLIFTVFLFLLALIIRFAAPESSIGQLMQYLSSPGDYKLQVIKINKNSP